MILRIIHHYFTHHSMNKESRPFLKWAGNKYNLVERIKNLLPPGKRLVEPFCGSAAIFLGTHYSNYLLAESNPDLITLYQELKKGGKEFINYTKTFFKEKYNEKKYYCELREKFNTTEDPTLKSALFIYLNRHGYNGLCRYNSEKKFNVPFGRFDKIYFPEHRLNYFHQKAQFANFTCQDFRKTLKKLRKTDVVYCDPPYVPLSKTACFTNYNGKTFSEEDQIELAKSAEKLKKDGITVIISNHDTPFTRKIYHQAEIHSFEVKRTISQDPSTRMPVKELLAVYR